MCEGLTKLVGCYGEQARPLLLAYTGGVVGGRGGRRAPRRGRGRRVPLPRLGAGEVEVEEVEVKVEKEVEEEVEEEEVVTVDRGGGGGRPPRGGSHSIDILCSSSSSVITWRG